MGIQDLVIRVTPHLDEIFKPRDDPSSQQPQGDLQEIIGLLEIGRLSDIVANRLGDPTISTLQIDLAVGLYLRRLGYKPVLFEPTHGFIVYQINHD
ncbi:hypothetical protein HYX02_02630 [Candidatus Woesearchaeota archaeon]|nr:hypothetical protein [Candidatus Woesearchaeota archaeon]